MTVFYNRSTDFEDLFDPVKVFGLTHPLMPGFSSVIKHNSLESTYDDSSLDEDEMSLYDPDELSIDDALSNSDEFDRVASIWLKMAKRNT
jgi:hypothetical protein